MPKKRSWTDEQLTKAVEESRSMRAVIEALGLIPAGGNYAQVQRRITELDLEVTHFTGMGWNKGTTYHTSTRPELETLLVLNGTVQSFKLNKRLYAKVSEDGRIPVELDHVNGDHHDNRLENLRILCPNCHSLQPTHRGKNKKVWLVREVNE